MAPKPQYQLVAVSSRFKLQMSFEEHQSRWGGTLSDFLIWVVDNHYQLDIISISGDDEANT